VLAFIHLFLANDLLNSMFSYFIFVLIVFPKIYQLKIQVVCSVTPCPLVNSYGRFGGFTASIRSVAAEEETLNLKVSRSSETSVIIYQSTQRNIPEDLNLQYRCENFTFRI
jgi:hypothetical protein